MQTCSISNVFNHYLLLQVKRVRCESSGVLVPKDKAIKRFIVRNMVDASAIRDLQDSCAIEGEFYIA